MNSGMARQMLRRSFVLWGIVFSVLNADAQDATESRSSTPPQATPPQATPPEHSAPLSDRQQLIVLVGAPGTDEYGATFRSWSARWEEAAKRAEINCTVISPVPVAAKAAFETTTSEKTTPETAPPVTDLQRLREAIASASEVKSEEPLWIVFIGHGTFDGRTASWNLQGPDVSAEQLAEACKRLQRPLAIVACASCSAPFINALSGTDRVIISATKDGNQIQYSRFGEAMSLAISTLEADINRDGQTSLKEAWLFASRRTAEFYKTEGRLATEHSLLDDNGDSQGIRSELYEGDRIVANVEKPQEVDGPLAARWSFVRSEEERRLTPEQRQSRDTLEIQLEELKRRKETMAESEYLIQLEVLMLPLAELYKSVDQ